MDKTDIIIKIIVCILNFTMAFFFGRLLRKKEAKYRTEEYQLNCKRFTKKGKAVFSLIFTIFIGVIAIVLSQFLVPEVLENAMDKMTRFIRDLFIIMFFLSAVSATFYSLQYLLTPQKHDVEKHLTYRLIDIMDKEKETKER